MEKETVIKIENVKKQYRLGAIGGGTLRGDLQSWWARKRGKEDPNLKIGQEIYASNEKFYALSGISFEVYKGERLGIIGGNGAGKSTTLKLLSRVTAPTEGNIYIKGRISSMLEVGTGFHPELTGRENIYLNGAILGMSKAEVDSKIEDIIDFSECRQFIDTPVKRYSSGMYVKLAFAVAAHLDSEILIMDEVLAVGDVNFQQKCLDKMRRLSKDEDRTVLYVSHNMNTIRQLCDRCIVLNNGAVIFDGDVEQAIAIYSNSRELEIKKDYDISSKKRASKITGICHMNSVHIEKSIININETLNFNLIITSDLEINQIILRFVIFNQLGFPVGTAYSKLHFLRQGKNVINYSFSTFSLMPGKYTVDLIVCEFDDIKQIRHDIVTSAFSFKIEESENYYNMNWNQNGWGSIKLNDIKVKRNG